MDYIGEEPGAQTDYMTLSLPQREVGNRIRMKTQVSRCLVCSSYLPQS